jgi:hypothetical protein
VAGARTAFLAGTTRPLAWRVGQLQALLAMYNENEELLCAALGQDLRKPKQEAVALEVEFLRNDVRGCLNNVSSWVEDCKVEKNIVTLLDSTFLHPDPLVCIAVQQ